MVGLTDLGVAIGLGGLLFVILSDVVTSEVRRHREDRP